MFKKVIKSKNGGCMAMKKRKILSILLSFVMIITTMFFVTPSLGTVAEAAPTVGDIHYYVSPTGLDSNDGLSSTTPWLTFTKAMPYLRAGNTLYLMGGKYVAVGGSYYCSGVNHSGD